VNLPMRRLLAVLPLSLLLAPAAAHAATVTTDRTCYLQTDKTNVTVMGSGFTAGQPYTVSLDGQELAGGSHAIDANGAMQGAFAPPVLGNDELERTFSVGVAANGVSATSKFTVTRVKATFSPATGKDVRTMRVRFSVAGMGLDRPHPTIYLHYIAPDGKLKQTLRLGQATGQCGRIEKTKLRRLFPFIAPAYGWWNLQFDTRKSFTKGKAGVDFMYYWVGVCVRPAGTSSAKACPRTGA
jgi:hypothetical protein